ncbi:hypothetical protein [Glaesserella parasuis]|uniref:hypothetical protein n=1 Tax=Glaesserella parasuis TaxID=738 RepID=UPI0038559130
MGAATGYSVKDIELFLLSLKHINYTEDVVLFIHNKQRIHFEKYVNENSFPFHINLVKSKAGLFYSKRINRKLKKIINTLSISLVNLIPYLKGHFIYKLALPHVSRFFDYFNYINKLDEVRNIILTDIRDVIFQRDPFLDIKGLYVGMESPEVPMGKDFYSKKWITEVYGDDYFENIKNNQICCAGVTLGDYHSIKKYLQTMLNEFLSLPYETIISSNYDQGIHNKLLYNNELLNPIQCQPLSSVISTIGIIDRNNLLFDLQNNLLLSDGCPAYIVHQYDRHTDILEKYQYKFSKYKK